MTAVVGGRVLVSGASGFLGRRLCARLQRDGAEIHAVSRSRHGEGEDGLRWWRLAMDDAEAVDRLVQDTKPEQIFHLSGLSNGAPGLDLVQSTFQSQLASTVNVLTAAARSGCRRVILIGSLEEPTAAAEDGVPASPYGAAKWGAAMYARMFHRLYQTPVVIARVYMAYGPGQAEGKIVPYTIRSLLQGQAPQLSSGRRCLDWIYVDDAVEAMVKATRSAFADGRIYHVVGDDSLTREELATLYARRREPHLRIIHLPLGLACALAGGIERLCNLLGRTAPIAPYRLRSAYVPLSFDCGKAREELGWRPRVKSGARLREHLLA